MHKYLSMSLLKFQYKNKTWGIVRNQKCASTSILSYVAHVLWNADVHDVQAYKTFEQNAPGVYIKKNYFQEYEKELNECDVRVAVWRDPVDKFISGYYHTMFSPTGAQDQLWIGEKTLDEFLKNYEYYHKNSMNVRDHCESNTARLGNDKKFYTHVFEYKTADAVALMLGINQTVKHRIQNKHEINTEQTDKIKKILQEDYINGWCQ